MVGTAEKKLGLTFSTVAQKLSAWNRSATNADPPASSGDTTLTMIPLTWNRGSTSRLRVSPVISNQSMMIRAVAPTLAWSSMTPLGRPVVPLV